MIKENDPLPCFSALLNKDQRLTEKDFKDGNFILYFYPKDDTPGCTKEACDFRDFNENFKNAQYKIYGISKDNLEKHDRFKNKYELPFDLLMDDTGTMCDAFDVWKEKSFMGKKYMGIERSTFLIKNGIIKKAWRKVSVTSHIQDILKDI